MRRFYTLALSLSMVLALAALAAGEDAPSSQITREITLRQTTSDFVLRALGRDALGNPVPSDQRSVQVVKPDGAPIKMTDNSGLLSTGVTSITPTSPKTLSITASPEAFARAAAIIDQMDVKPRIVQISAEYYEIDAELGQEFARVEKQVDTEPAESVPNQRAFRDKLKASGLNPLATATISTLSYTKGECTSSFSVSPSDTSTRDDLRTLKTTLSATPKIHSDGTITITVTASFTSWHWDSEHGIYQQRTQSLNTTRRSVSGEPVVAGGFTRFTGKETVFVLTARVQE